MTEDDAKKLVAMLFAAFPTETVNVTPEAARASARAYASVMVDLDVSVATGAVQWLMKTAMRLPPPAAIRATCVEIQHGPKRPGGDAWGDVVKAMRQHGSRRSPGVDFKFDDPLVAKTVDALSWRSLCLSENQVADRARFIELYDSMSDGARREAQLAEGATSKMLPPAPRNALGPQPVMALLPGGRE